ncbi:hypothetical protein, partial [Candidatus Parabeggiatoa sp. HSG14]|uniref:hypothetical protein n=1 Tax=Candidatus Parabeggiatoa sp. HSG14 TaxID=3055593 RepID=UPI0025A75FA2|nr:hypothetical protein [Thiotrichales bacterium HSG14]
MLRTALPKVNIGVQNLFCKGCTLVGKINFALLFGIYLRNISYIIYHQSSQNILLIFLRLLSFIQRSHNQVFSKAYQYWVL